MIHSSTLGFSTHPPVSVYGTGPYTLNDIRFSCKSAYLRYPLGRGLAVLSGLSLPNPFNRLFRQTAAVSLLGLSMSRNAGIGILTDYTSDSPLGCSLVPD